MVETIRSTGTVKWFSAQKGFGFIAPDKEGEEDLFVHQTSIKSDGFRTLSEGQSVEFAVDVGEDGRTKAVDVVAVSRSRRYGSRGGGGGSGFYGGRGRRGSYVRGGRGGPLGRGGGACFNCGRTGHLARECYSLGGGVGGRGYGGGGGRGGGGCFNCGEEGHFARDCQNE